MNYYSEADIRAIVSEVVAKAGFSNAASDRAPILVETSARHVHLTAEATEILFGHPLTKKRDLSQPGEFVTEERLKLVTAKGEISNVAVLGPVRKAVQVELSMTDCRSLGLQAPVNLSGDLTGAADVLLIGPAGFLMAKGAVIVAKAHVHMTPEDAKTYGVQDGEQVSIRLNSKRPITLNDVLVRVKPNFSLAVHIDFDEANAALADSKTTGELIKSR